MNIEDLIRKLESHWDEDGFLHRIRRGDFDSDEASSFLDLLRCIDIAEDELIPKRLLSLLWMLPLFLEWQKERIAEVDASKADAYDKVTTQVENVLIEVLGVP